MFQFYTVKGHEICDILQKWKKVFSENTVEILLGVWYNQHNDIHVGRNGDGWIDHRFSEGVLGDLKLQNENRMQNCIF